jgi:hypothetical protein
VRNRGTIGGSLAHADPAADWPLALAVLDATVVVRGTQGRARRLAADAFMLSTFTTALAQDEVIEFIEVPKRPPSTRYGYFKFCRKTGDYPETSAAVVLEPEARGARPRSRCPISRSGWRPRALPPPPTRPPWRRCPGPRRTTIRSRFGCMPPLFNARSNGHSANDSDSVDRKR